MCGIAGFLYADKPVSDNGIIKKMLSRIAHRGPDGDGVYVHENVALGHKRLAILDLTSAGKQPMSTEDGSLVITFNGEIYNFAELRNELIQRGHSFSSRTDTEVVLKGYLEWGDEVFKKLNGMFALAIYDKRSGELVIARDRFGIKPVYVSIQNDKIIFASEIKAILVHPGYRFDINYEALNEYFTFQNLFRFHTLFKGIQLLAPARILKFDKQLNLKEWSYWDYNFTDTDERIDEKTAEEETFRLFQQAVERQMVADVRVGCYLSGGMDSGSITSVASRQTSRLATFTCGFDMSATTGREANFDERRDAELMASYYKTEHYEQVLNSSDLSWAMPKLVYHLEDLRVGMSYPNYYISGLASKFVKVCLSGAGGDELYGGYPWRYYRVSKSLNRDDYFKEYYSFWQRLVNDEDKKQLFNSEVYSKTQAGRDPFSVFKNVFLYNDKLSYGSPEDHVKNSLYFEAKTFLPALFLVGDKLAMAHSMEERFPFMDNDLVDFAQKIPVRYKLGKFDEMTRIDENDLGKLRRYEMQFDDGKNVLRKSMSRILPKQILQRKKQGFSAPDESWYRGENFQYVSSLITDKKKSRLREFINPAYIDKTLDEHCNQNVNHRLLIWSFICLEWWLRHFVFNETEETA